MIEIIESIKRDPLVWVGVVIALGYLIGKARG